MTEYRSEDIADLAARIDGALRQLMEMHKEATRTGDLEQARRLRSKVSGVHLVLDFLRAYEVQP